MKQFCIKKSNLINRFVNNELHVYSTKDKNELELCINLFNSKLKWEKMFDITEAMQRIKNNEIFYIAKHNKKIFGYFWIKKHYENKFKIYNVFSTRENESSPYGATDMIYLGLNNFKENTFFNAEVDDWNVKSQKVFEKLGFVKCE